MVTPIVAEIGLHATAHPAVGAELRGAVAVQQVERLLGESSLKNEFVLVTPAAERAGRQVLEHTTGAPEDLAA